MAPTVLAIRVAVAVLCLAANGAFASPLQSLNVYALKDAHAVPRTFSKVGPASAGQVLDLQIGLTQARFAELEQKLYDGKFPEAAALR